MRESLFRGKRLDNGEWVSSGNLITFNDEGEGKQFFIPQMNAKCTCTHDEQDNIISFDSGMFYKVDPDTVGQFTGLTDKNGKRVFEHDVIKHHFGDEIGVIRYGEYRNPFGDDSHGGHVGFYVDWVSGTEPGLLRKDLAYWMKIVDILGNIHDNPELLGGAGGG